MRSIKQCKTYLCHQVKNNIHSSNMKAHLIERLDPKLVNVNTGLVLSLGIPHAPCVFEVLGLVLPSLAQVHDNLRGAGVQGVEVGPVILVQALGGEVIDTPQPVHQLPEMNIFLLNDV